MIACFGPEDHACSLALRNSTYKAH